MNFYEVPKGQTPICFVNSITGETVSFHSLPLSSRTPGEVLEDMALEFAIQESIDRSISRRKIARFNSQVVIEALDEVDQLTRAVGNLAVRQLHLMHPILRQLNSPSDLEHK